MCLVHLRSHLLQLLLHTDLQGLKQTLFLHSCGIEEPGLRFDLETEELGDLEMEGHELRGLELVREAELQRGEHGTFELGVVV